MKKLVLSLGDVPQTGRSTCLEVLQGVLRERSVPNLRLHTDASQPVGPGRSRFLDLSGGWLADDFIGWLDVSALVLLDVATGEGQEFLDFYAESELPEMLAEIDATVTLVTSVTDDVDSEHFLRAAAETLRDDAEYVVVRGAAHVGWQSSACERAMHHLGAVEIGAPALPAWIAEDLDGEGRHVFDLLSRRATLNRSVDAALRTWEADFAAELGAAAELLWPEGLDRSHSPLTSIRTRGAAGARRAAGSKVAAGH